LKVRDNKIDFASVLAAAVHDMKNSLSLMIQSIEELESTLNQHNIGTDQVALIHYQAARMNTGLIQLLSLYRTQLDQLPLNVDQHYIDDFVDDILALNQNHITTRHFDIRVNQQQGLHWFFDLDLMDVLISDVLVNAMRYGRHLIAISIFEQDGWLNIKIEDDGPGYPDTMLSLPNTELSELDISAGRTGLGLFFARLIAEAHISNDRKGHIQLSNGGSLGGGVFVLRLP